MLNRNFYNRVNSNFLLIEYIHLLIKKIGELEMKKIVGLLAIAVLFGSCGVQKNITQLGTTIRSPYKGQITVLEEGSEIPEGAEKVASIFVGENGLTTKCNYEYILSELIKEAGRYGANYLVFVERQNPSWRSSCYQMRALAYWVDPSLLNKQKEVKKEEKNTDE